jgi:hypothetical protein
MGDLVERLRYLANLDCTEENFGSIPPTYLSEAADRIEALEEALYDAFMAMCSHRDNPDDEVFQDAIDALGLACEIDAALSDTAEPAIKQDQ